jgi:hypothetical protein
MKLYYLNQKIASEMSKKRKKSCKFYSDTFSFKSKHLFQILSAVIFAWLFPESNLRAFSPIITSQNRTA